MTYEEQKRIYDIYKVKNPTKYAQKKEAFEKKLSELKGEEVSLEEVDIPAEPIDIATLKKDELVKMAKDLKLDTSGTKTDIIKRITSSIK